MRQRANVAYSNWYNSHPLLIAWQYRTLLPTHGRRELYTSLLYLLSRARELSLVIFMRKLFLDTAKEALALLFLVLSGRCRGRRGSGLFGNTGSCGCR